MPEIKINPKLAGEGWLHIGCESADYANSINYHFEHAETGKRDHVLLDLPHSQPHGWEMADAEMIKRHVKQRVSAQELASRFANRMVLWRANEMMDTLRSVHDHLDSDVQSELEALMYAEPDYEEAAAARGWEAFDALVGEVFVRKAENEVQAYEESARLLGWDLASCEDAFPDADFEYEYEYEYLFVREAGATYESTLTHLVPADDEDDAWEKLCKELELTTFAETDDSSDSWEELCNMQGIDADEYRPEVYEWYIVDAWWCQKIGPAVLGSLLDFNVWGRTCTGQSISLDYNVQQAAIEMWPDEWDGKR